MTDPLLRALEDELGRLRRYGHPLRDPGSTGSSRV